MRWSVNFTHESSKQNLFARTRVNFLYSIDNHVLLLCISYQGTLFYQHSVSRRNGRRERFREEETRFDISLSNHGIFHRLCPWNFVLLSVVTDSLSFVLSCCSIPCYTIEICWSFESYTKQGRCTPLQIIF